MATKAAWHEVIMSAQAADETKSTVIGPAIASRCQFLTFYVKWNTGTSAGVVEIETSADPADTGTWAPLATVTFSGTAPKQDVVQVEGTGLAFRARISTAVADGTVTVTFVGN